VTPPFALCKPQVSKYAQFATSRPYRITGAGRQNDEEFNEENNHWLDTQDQFAGSAVAKE